MSISQALHLRNCRQVKLPLSVFCVRGGFFMRRWNKSLWYSVV